MAVRGFAIAGAKGEKLNILVFMKGMKQLSKAETIET